MSVRYHGAGGSAKLGGVTGGVAGPVSGVAVILGYDAVSAMRKPRNVAAEASHGGGPLSQIHDKPKVPMGRSCCIAWPRAQPRVQLAQQGLQLQVTAGDDVVEAIPDESRKLSCRRLAAKLGSLVEIGRAHV